PGAPRRLRTTPRPIDTVGRAPYHTGHSFWLLVIGAIFSAFVLLLPERIRDTLTGGTHGRQSARAPPPRHPHRALAGRREESLRLLSRRARSRRRPGAPDDPHHRRLLDGRGRQCPDPSHGRRGSIQVRPGPGQGPLAPARGSRGARHPGGEGGAGPDGRAALGEPRGGRSRV